ncbi:hypothetical protein ACF1BQ_005520 [Bradyrhizobium sp. RDT10]
MLMIDMRNSTARITMREITAAGRRYASSPIALSSFMAGVQLTPEVLLEGRGGAQQGRRETSRSSAISCSDCCRSSTTYATWRRWAAVSPCA